MKTLTKLALVLSVVLFVSCDKSQTLQEYYVDNQDNADFMTMDLPMSLLGMAKGNMSDEDRATMESIKKVNLLAFPKKEGSQTDYETEKEKLTKILNDDKFKVLMKFNQNGMNAKVMYLGEDDAIDEVILFGEDYERGFGVARILGDNMKPENIIKMMEGMKGMDGSMMGMDQIEDFAKAFEEKS